MIEDCCNAYGQTKEEAIGNLILLLNKQKHKKDELPHITQLYVLDENIKE